MASLLLIDDDIELTELLSEYLTQQGFNVSVCNNGKEGLHVAKKEPFDVILLDVMLPEMDGFEVLKALRTHILTPVIMLTAKGDDFDRIFGLELGADDYIPKPFNHRELVARIRAITRRVEFCQQPSTLNPKLQVSHLCMDLMSRSVLCHDNQIIVTGTEFEILHMLLQKPGQIISKQDISVHVLGRRLAPFDRSIDMHVSNLRKKIQTGTHNPIQTVRGIGYVLTLGDDA
ncbi:response regulator transcription factor [Pseudoalteromonas xiamenensis]|uniref:response regulator transcription factor n=1 Tax=Pseudoalteromonas xiamenensis TaxID=882626 RepID=UPI0027E4E451|nr:response regulator transcription factor [Pseudoalteromonas xiamenensis]WMN61059.1 response regulator transcription factor [Pseudoalteromonas xiamenensis]